MGAAWPAGWLEKTASLRLAITAASVSSPPNSSAAAASFGGPAVIPRDRFRWSTWAKGLSGENLVRFVRDEVFPFYAEVAERSAVNFMDGARLAIDEPTVLTQVVNKVDELAPRSG